MDRRDRGLPLIPEDTPLPFRPVSPGNILKDELEARGWTTGDLAARSRLTARVVTQVLRARRPVTADVALALGKALRMSPEMWLRLEAYYQMTLLRDHRKASRRRGAAA